MINLRNSPFLWFSLLLLLAYGLAEIPGALSFFQLDLIQILIWVICVICGALGMVKYLPGRQFYSTLAIGFLIMVSGWVRLSHFSSSVFLDPPITNSIRMHGTLQVRQVLKVKENSISLRCIVDFLTPSDTEVGFRYPDRFILVQVRDPDSRDVFPGDVLQAEGWASLIQGPKNPHAFDIRPYYTTLGIRHQLFCKGDEISILPAAQNSLARLTAKWQTRLSSAVRNHTSPEVAQLTNALVWGDRSDMADEVRDAFADSGAMHVLSVSGMHVAIIYSMLYLVLGAPGSGSFPRRMIRLAAYSMAIILYVGLTGACPAVVRAGLMILLYLIGKAMGWNTPIWNLLGFAAFIMLWINPYAWKNVGFQLSFLAMAGILMYAQPIIRSLSFKNKILHVAWEITAVSIAAQIFILPFLLMQFHQFPLTFILSSLVAMPASYVIIFGALLNVVMSAFEMNWLWPLFDQAGIWFILCMKWMAGLNPGMNFYLPGLTGALLLMMGVVFTIALVLRWSKGKNIAYVLGITTMITLCYHRITQWRTDDLVIYYQSQGLLTDIMINGHCISIIDSILTPQGIEFASRGYRSYRDVIHTFNLGRDDEYHSHQLSYRASVLQIDTLHFLIWDGKADSISLQQPFSHILVEQCPDVSLCIEFIRRHQTSLYILPPYLKRYPKNVLLKYLRENHVPVYDMSQLGYFKISL